MQQGSDQRQLLQPTQWTGYENPQWNGSPYPSLPTHNVLPSAPPVSTSYYDQVSGNVQSVYDQVPRTNVQPIQQQMQQPIVVSPIIINTPPTVNVGVTIAPAPRVLAGCCKLGNETSSKIILCALLLISATAAFISILVIKEWACGKMVTTSHYHYNGGWRDYTTTTSYEIRSTEEIVLFIIILALTLPTAILFPGTFMALNGIYNGKTTGLNILLTILNIYKVIVFVAACCTIVAIFPCIAFAPLIMFFLVIQLAFICIVHQMTKVLSDYRITILRRNQTIHH